MILNLLFDLCRWKVEDGGVEVVHGAMIDYYPNSAILYPY